MKENQMSNEFKGFSLFNDIEENELRIRNQAVILTNMAEDNSKDKKITPKGAALILGYFNRINEQDRFAVKNAFVVNMRQRGFQLE